MSRGSLIISVLFFGETEIWGSYLVPLSSRQMNPPAGGRAFAGAAVTEELQKYEEINGGYGGGL